MTGLRRTGLWAELDYLGRSLKAQMKAADRLKCKWVVIVGEEVEQNTVKSGIWLQVRSRVSVWIKLEPFSHLPGRSREHDLAEDPLLQ